MNKIFLSSTFTLNMLEELNCDFESEICSWTEIEDIVNNLNHHGDGKTAIIVDDMISSGASMIDTMNELHKRGVSHIYVMATYALFTKGIDDFRKYHDDKILDGMYVSNLSYIKDEYKLEPWLHVCDCSNELAKIIYNFHNDLSISTILNDRTIPMRLLEKKFSENKKVNE